MRTFLIVVASAVALSGCTSESTDKGPQAVANLEIITRQLRIIKVALLPICQTRRHVKSCVTSWTETRKSPQAIAKSDLNLRNLALQGTSWAEEFPTRK